MVLAYSDSALPGAARFVSGLKQGLEELDIDPRILLYVQGRRVSVLPSSDLLVRAPDMRSARTANYIGMLRVLKAILLERPEAIIVYDPLWPIAVPALVAARRLRIPALIVCGEIGYVNKRGLIRSLEQCIEFWLLLWGSAVLCLPGECEEFLRRKLPRVKRIHKIPNVCVPPMDEPMRSTPLSETRKQLDKKDIVAYVGSCGEYSGVEDLWKAASDLLTQFPNLVVLFVGPRDRVPAELSKLGAVVSLGWVSVAEMNEYFRFAHLGVVTASNSIVNRFKDPIKTYEYLKFGIPVIAARIGGAQEIVRASGCGLCYEPGNPSDLAAKMALLLSKPSLALEMGLKGKAHVERHNGPRRVAEVVLSIARGVTK